MYNFQNSSVDKYIASYGYQPVNDPLGSVMPSDKYLYSSQAQQINFKPNNDIHKSQNNSADLHLSKNIEGSRLDFDHYQKKYSYLYNPEKLIQEPTDQQNYQSINKKKDDNSYKTKLYPTNKVEFSKYFDSQTDRNYYNYMKFKNQNNAYDNFRQESNYLQSSADQYFRDKQKFSDTNLYKPRTFRESPALNYPVSLERVEPPQQGYYNNERQPISLIYQPQPVLIQNQFDGPFGQQYYNQIGPQFLRQYHQPPHIQEKYPYLQYNQQPVYRSQYLQRELPVFTPRVSNQIQREYNYDSNVVKQSAGQIIDYNKQKEPYKQVSRKASLQQVPNKYEFEYNFSQNNFDNNQIKSNYNNQFLNKSFDYAATYQQQSQQVYQPYNILQQPPVIVQEIQPITQYLPPSLQQQSPLYAQHQELGQYYPNLAYNENFKNNNLVSPQFPQYFSPQQQSYLLENDHKLSQNNKVDRENIKFQEEPNQNQVKYIVKEEEQLNSNDTKNYLSPLKMNQNQQIKQQSQQYYSQQQPQQQVVQIQPQLQQKQLTTQQVREDQQIQQKQVQQKITKKQIQLQESPIENQKYFSLGCGSYQCAQYRTSQSHMRRPSSQLQLQQLNNDKTEEQQQQVVLQDDQSNMESKLIQKQEGNKEQGVEKVDNLFNRYYVYQPIFTNKSSYNALEPVNLCQEQKAQNQYEVQQQQQSQPVQQVFYQNPPQAQIVQQLMPVAQQPTYIIPQDLKLSNQSYIQNPEQFVISTPYPGPFQSQFIQNQPVTTLIPVSNPEYVGSNPVILPQQGGQYILQQPLAKIVQPSQQKQSQQQQYSFNNNNLNNSNQNNFNQCMQKQSNKKRIFEGYEKQPSHSQKLKHSLQNFNNMQFSSPYVMQDNRQQQLQYQSKQQYL